MTMMIRDAGGTLRQIAGIAIRDAGNVLRTVERVTMRGADNVLRTIFEAMSASASPVSVRGYGNSAGTLTITTPAVTATPSGGVASFTYAWTRTDGGAQPWTIVAPSAATTGFSTDCDSGESEIATFQCEITDATGASAVTGDVNAHAINLGGGL